jgi:hypothetical protein
MTAPHGDLHVVYRIPAHGRAEVAEIAPDRATAERRARELERGALARRLRDTFVAASAAFALGACDPTHDPGCSDCPTPEVRDVGGDVDVIVDDAG